MSHFWSSCSPSLVLRIMISGSSTCAKQRHKLGACGPCNSLPWFRHIETPKAYHGAKTASLHSFQKRWVIYRNSQFNSLQFWESVINTHLVRICHEGNLTERIWKKKIKTQKWFVTFQHWYLWGKTWVIFLSSCTVEFHGLTEVIIFMKATSLHQPISITSVSLRKSVSIPQLELDNPNICTGKNLIRFALRYPSTLPRALVGIRKKQGSSQLHSYFLRSRPRLNRNSMAAEESRRHSSCHSPPIRVFTQMTRRQKFDARPGTDWTVFLMLSIGCHIKLERASNFCQKFWHHPACVKILIGF